MHTELLAARGWIETACRSSQRIEVAVAHDAAAVAATDDIEE